MVADPKHELRALIDQLSDDDAAKTLAFARQLLDVHRAQARPPADVPAPTGRADAPSGAGDCPHRRPAGGALRDWGERHGVRGHDSAPALS